MRKVLVSGVLLAATGMAAGQVFGPDPRTPDQIELDVLATFDFEGDTDEVGPKSPDSVRPPGPEDSDDGPPLGLRGGPANDFCDSATIIPLGTVTYNPPLLGTTGATITICEAFEDCESGNVGVSDSVWYSYTAAADGRISVNTFGSNYNTVLSIWDGCGSGFLPPCPVVPNQLACNDNAGFGTQSEVSLDVFEGETYLIKVSDYNTTPGGGLLDFNLFYYPPNDLCDNATEIPGVVAYDPPLLATHNAQTGLCEASESCEFNGVGVSNAVWYAFIAPCDGSLSLNTNGSTYDTVLSVFDGCGEFVAVDAPCNLPNELACDDDAGTGTNSQLLGVPVTGGNRYLIKVADYNTSQGGGYLDFNLFFSGATPPTVTLDAPAPYECVCDSIPITGTAATPDSAPVEWKLEYRGIADATWNPIASSQTEVVGGLLATWFPGALSQGQYLLRLTATNACGISDTAIQIVHVDRQFDVADLPHPAPGTVLGGLVCLDGSAYDTWCFDSYQATWVPAGGGVPAPVDPAFPNYATGVVNNPLAQWDTLVAGVPDGDYLLELTGTTVCGDTAGDSVVVTIDNTAPVARLDNPMDCELVDGVLEIFGTAQDDNLVGWSLQVTGGPYVGWQTLASGNTSVIGGLLGIWDTSTLPPCAYTLRLLVTDAAAVNCNAAITHQSEDLASVIVDANPCPGDVDGDGDVDVTDLAIILANFGQSCF